jgi:hypothetical protein
MTIVASPAMLTRTLEQVDEIRIPLIVIPAKAGIQD